MAVMKGSEREEARERDTDYREKGTTGEKGSGRGSERQVCGGREEMERSSDWKEQVTIGKCREERASK